MKWPLLLLLTLLPCVGFSQTISTGKVCFTPQQAAQLADSLKALPFARAEAQQWQRSASAYQNQAASLTTALASERTLTADAEARATKYRTRAHRKGWLNAGLSAALVAVLYLFIAK